MYETFFGLKRRPFLAVPDMDSYFSIDIVEEARQTIERTVRRGEGISLIFGPSGTGKTLLLRLIRQALETDFTVSLIANGHLETPKSFFQQLLFDLRLPYSGGDESELRLQLLDFARREANPAIALLIDESQFLDRSVLEEIRLLMNCDDGAAPFFRAVLAGTIEFEEKLTHPKLEAFNQRVVGRSYLEPFSREETDQYIDWQSNLSREKPEAPFDLSEDIPDPASGLAEFIENSGVSKGHRIDSPHVKTIEPIFTQAAKRQIHRLTDGVPRLINQLCDTSMQLAAERVLRSVDEIIVHSSWARLQQIDESEVPEEADRKTGTVSNAESIEEIVARKKATFRLKEFDSAVQFGTLEPEIREEEPEVFTETEAVAPIAVEEGGTDFETAVVLETDAEIEEEEDDIDSFAEELDNELLFATPDGPAEVSKPLPELSHGDHEAEDIAVEIEATTDAVTEEVETEKVVRFWLPSPLSCRRRTGKGSKKYSHRKRRHPILKTAPVARQTGCFVSLSLTFRYFGDTTGGMTLRPFFCPLRSILPAPYVSGNGIDVLADDATPETAIVEDAETQNTSTEPSFEEPPMDLETLERYGAEILEGRPPFVRKEPNYAYRTNDSDNAAEQKMSEIPYPDPVTGNVIMLRWVQPENRDDIGFGTAYRDFLERIAEAEDIDNVVEIVSTAPIVLEPVEVGSENVIRIVLDENDREDRTVKSRTALDESFDEIALVQKNVIALDDIFRSGSIPAPADCPVDRPTPGEAVFQRQFDAVLERITQAAEKIEQAAEVSEEAGRHVRKAADFVESEVQAALPTYIDLFQELSEFQRTISTELSSIRELDRFSEAMQKLRNPLGPATESLGQDSVGTAFGLARTAKLLPFPRRPNFGPEEPAIVSDGSNPVSQPDYPKDGEPRDDLPKDDQSIDVRTLFQ